MTVIYSVNETSFVKFDRFSGVLGHRGKKALELRCFQNVKVVKTGRVSKEPSFSAYSSFIAARQKLRQRSPSRNDKTCRQKRSRKSGLWSLRIVICRLTRLFEVHVHVNVLHNVSQIDSKRVRSESQEAFTRSVQDQYLTLRPNASVWRK